MKTLIVEGWRVYPQSLSIVNQFQCLELLRRSDVRLLHRDMPPPPQQSLLGRNTWKRQAGLFPADAEERIRSIPAPSPDDVPDATLRVYFPYDFSPAPRGRTFAFSVTEYGRQHRFIMAGRSWLKDALAGNETVIITPSRWSRDGLINSGAEPERVVVVPHGVDTGVYRPLDDEERTALRRSMGWEDAFIFLAVGGMYPRKGVGPLLKGFAAVAAEHPRARLFLKGIDTIYRSRLALQTIGRELTQAEAALIQPRVRYVGDPFSFAGMARLYQAADVFVSPYHAEGFNMPALEALACGLPVICTGGGPTDDFTRDDFALRIESSVEPAPDLPGIWLRPDPDHLVALMTRSIADEAFLAKARIAGPAHVRAGYTWGHVTDRLVEVLFPPSGT